MTQQEAERVLESHLSQLMEHFDSVRVIVTRHDNQTNSTKLHSYGAGNFYAQYGSVAAWLEAQESVMVPEEEPDE